MKRVASEFPFIVRQANAAEMISTFWICELEETDAYGNPRLIMQYLQIVLLDFFRGETDCRDRSGGRMCALTLWRRRRAGRGKGYRARLANAKGALTSV